MESVHPVVDALAHDYLRLGLATFVNNLWTWLTVFAAAVSFWRITVPSKQPLPIASVSPESGSTASSSAVSDAAVSSETETPDAVLVDGVAISPTKGKFVMYFEDNSIGKCDEDGDDKWETEYSDGGEERWGQWDWLAKKKLGEVEWYKYQEMTVFNGNVVRLWDEIKRNHGR